MCDVVGKERYYEFTLESDDFFSLDKTGHLCGECRQKLMEFMFK